MRRFLVWMVVLGAVLFGAWYHETEWPVRRADAAPQTLVVAPGTRVLEIGRELQGLGLVRHPEVFRLLVVSKRAAGRLRAGEYSLEGTMSLADVVDKLARGDVVRRTVTFPEGTSMEDMARIAATKGLPAADFLRAARDPAPIEDLDPDAPDLEGYLFPDTYDLPRGPDPSAQLVARMVKRFREVIAPELPGLPPTGLTLRKAVTLASIVEVETARPEERARVASVFLNRLKRRMPLQTDPTVIYALRKAGRWDGNIRREDLDLDSPYNTYRRQGLPPGPIASPGHASILAALHPEATRDVYFVSRNDGTHQFSETLAEHERWVTLYQRHRAVAQTHPSPGALPAASPAPGAILGVSPAPVASPRP